MTDSIGLPSESVCFKAFLFQNKLNKRILWLAAAAIIIQFAIFKYLYPFANFIHGDSFNYLEAAGNNQTTNYYLIGYSKFLRFVSIFAKPDIVLVGLQYLLIQSSALFLLFTIFYFYHPGKLVQWILLCFMVLNPLFLHLGNMVSSDGYFLALSLTWFTLMLWIIHQPSNTIIIWHGIVLFVAFTVRYNALIYPFIAIVALILSGLSIHKRIAGIVFPLLLCSWFIGLTMYQYKKLTGYWQFSPFSGWQWANNAMYAYRYVDSADRKPVLLKYKALDERIRKFYDRTRNLTMYPSEQAQASTFYMWSPGMPLMQYRDSLFRTKIGAPNDYKAWASMGPFYREYGIYIIKKYPLHFLRYFAWPNSNKYYAPPVEFLQSYNSKQNKVTKQAMKWFGYSTNKVKTRLKNSETWVLNFYPILSGIINVVMLFGLLYYILLKGWQYNRVFNKTIIMASTIWLFNAGFTIFASSAALRFQSFPVILTTTFTLLLVDWMAQLIRSMNKINKEELKSQISEQSIPVSQIS
jgi:hypothetical protein